MSEDQLMNMTLAEMNSIANEERVFLITEEQRQLISKKMRKYWKEKRKQQKKNPQ